jgi:hypothetical protein
MNTSFEPLITMFDFLALIVCISRAKAACGSLAEPL